MATAKKTPAKTGNVVALKKPSGGAIVSIQDALKAQAAANSEKTAPASGISIRVTQDKQFALPNGQKSDELQVVIVDFNSRNEFYEGAFDKDNMSSPACFAIGTSPSKLVPSANAPAAQCEDCASCPMNAFGSAGKGKACKNQRVLAVLPVDADEDTPVWLLKVSPTAIKGFDGYIQALSRSQQAPMEVVTTVSFDDNVTYASLRFKDGGINENVSAHFGRLEEAKELLSQEPDVSRYEAPKPKAAPARRPAVAGRR